MSGLLYRLGSLCCRHAYMVLGAWLLILVAVGACIFLIGRQTTNDITLPGTETQLATDLLTREFPPQQNGQSPIVFHVEDGRLTDADVKAAVQRSLKRIEQMAHVEGVIGPYSRIGRQLMSEDEKTALAQVLLDVNGGEVTKELAAEIMAGGDPARAAGVQVEAGGVLGIRLSEVTSHRSEMIGIGVGIVILAFTFGVLVAAAMPIVTAIIGLATGLGLIGLLGHVIDIPVVAPTLATMLALGVGIDYALFIVFRYRDELHAGLPVGEAIARAMATSGSAVVFAGCTVIIALLALLVAAVPMLGAMGYASALAVLVAVVTAVTFLPALLSLLGPRIDALHLPGWRRLFSSPDRENVWARWAGMVTRHPWISLTGALLVLVPLALPTLSLRLGQEDMGVTSTDTTTRRAFDLISDGLGPGANGRLLLAVEFEPAAQAGAAFTKKKTAAERLSRELETGARKLEREGAALKERRDALVSEQAGLRAQAAGLQRRMAALETSAAVLRPESSRLLAEQARLLSEKERLAESGEALAAEAQAAGAQIAMIRQQLATSQDPAEIAALQAELTVLLADAEDVQAQIAALQREGKELSRRAERLSAKGRALQTRSAALAAQGDALQGQSARLTAAGAALTRRGSELARDAGRLKREQRLLERRAEKAQHLKDELVDLLTKAGGQERATDPRLMRLQAALEAAAGVASVAPPLLNESGGAAVLTVTATTRPADPVTADLVTSLRDDVIPRATAGDGLTAHVGGVTAAYDDLAALISARLPLVIAVVLALSFLVLLVAFRSLLVPLKAILCNLLAVGAAFGVLTAVFQWGWGLELIGISSPYGTVPIASYVPLLMFCVLFGMSTDYEVFLISQIFGYHEAGEDSYQAVRSGVGASARVITAAALIMVTVFASFIQHPDPVIKQFGVGLSIAILLDATIVRLVIVPATMVLLGEWNWYLPRWLRWIGKRDLQPHGGSGSEVEPAHASPGE